MRTIPAATAALLTAVTLTGGTPVPASAGGPADGTTRVVLRMPDCEGCTVQVVSALATDDPDEPRLWASQERRVRDGRVAFPVPSSRTAGRSLCVALGLVKLRGVDVGDGEAARAEILIRLPAHPSHAPRTPAESESRALPPHADGSRSCIMSADEEGAQPAAKPVYFHDPALQALYQMVLVLA